MPAFSGRTSLRPILLAIQVQLQTVLAFPPERVTLVIRGDIPHFQADQDVLVRPRGFRVDKSWTDQAGRVATKIDRRIEVICRTRLQLDPSGSAQLWLTDETLGHVAFEEATTNALQGFFPKDDTVDHNALTCGEPLLLLEGDDPEQERKPQPLDWGETSLFFEVSYLLDLDQTLMP